MDHALWRRDEERLDLWKSGGSRRSGGNEYAYADANSGGQRLRPSPEPPVGKIGVRCTLATIAALNRPRRFHLGARLLLSDICLVVSWTSDPSARRFSVCCLLVAFSPTVLPVHLQCHRSLVVGEGAWQRREKVRR